MAPHARITEIVAINNLILVTQELGQRIALLEKTMHSFEHAIVRLEATVEQKTLTRSEQQQIELLLPLHTLAQSFDALRSEICGMRGIILIDQPSRPDQKTTN